MPYNVICSIFTNLLTGSALFVLTRTVWRPVVNQLVFSATSRSFF